MAESAPTRGETTACPVHAFVEEVAVANGRLCTRGTVRHARAAWRRTEVENPCNFI